MYIRTQTDRGRLAAGIRQARQSEGAGAAQDPLPRPMLIPQNYSGEMLRHSPPPSAPPWETEERSETSSARPSAEQDPHEVDALSDGAREERGEASSLAQRDTASQASAPEAEAFHPPSGAGGTLAGLAEALFGAGGFGGDTPLLLGIGLLLLSERREKTGSYLPGVGGWEEDDIVLFILALLLFT